MYLVRLSMSIAVVITLSACKPAEKPAVQATAAPVAASATPATAEVSTMAAASGSHDRDALQCDQQVGAAAAKRLADRCLMVSPASHPPCNVANSCDVIRSEIKRSCDLMGPKTSWPKECTS